GMGVDEARRIGQLILKVLGDLGDEAVMREVRDEVIGICGKFPVPGIDA
ncbi:MAG: serine hydroxymethyltransferase, partial [Chloroflexi bacterium]|nr:serine hydroxymethyltransferase [Chloroflexota bacterium]